MTDRNTLLADIAAQIGITDDLTGLERNSILREIAAAYGVSVPSDDMNDLLHGIDSILNLADMPRVGRNAHLKSIAETLGSITLGDNLSRHEYLQAWLDNAVSVIQSWILSDGSWNDDGAWDDAENWSDGE